MTKEYDRAYFEKWYRHPQTRIEQGATLDRKVHLAVAAAEQLLGRTLRSVLDVGCGEGAWYSPLLKLRPRVRYVGLDPSPYATRRFGRTRNVGSGTFGDLATLRFEEAFDLVVCSDVLHYVVTKELDCGLAGLAEMLVGMAYVEVMTIEDDPVGDLTGFHPRSAAWYAERFRKAGLVRCGLHCHIGPNFEGTLAALERAEV
jgi:SAM-dependent methyltransferase